MIDASLREAHSSLTLLFQLATKYLLPSLRLLGTFSTKPVRVVRHTPNLCVHKLQVESVTTPFSAGDEDGAARQVNLTLDPYLLRCFLCILRVSQNANTVDRG